MLTSARSPWMASLKKLSSALFGLLFIVWAWPAVTPIAITAAKLHAIIVGLFIRVSSWAPLHAQPHRFCVVPTVCNAIRDTRPEPAAPRRLPVAGPQLRNRRSIGGLYGFAAPCCASA